jgi:hypothetical protein
MENEKLKKLIERKEQEIKDLMKLKKFLSDEHLNEQIDLRLKDLTTLYKQRKK